MVGPLRCVRLPLPLLLVATLLACEGDPGNVPSEPGGALSGAGACKVAPIEALVPEIYATAKDQSEARGFCGEIERAIGRAEHLVAVTRAYEWLTRTFDLYRAGAVVPGSETEIERLFDVEVFGTLLAPSFAALPDDDAPDLSSLAEGLHLDPNLNGVVVTALGEACDEAAGNADPCIATTPNRHAALKLKQNGVHVVITSLPPQAAYGDCTAISDGLSHDCFDVQLHVAVFPEDAIVDPGVIGVCVNDVSPFAPGSDVTIGVTKGETASDGSLVLLPPAIAPGTLDCSDVEPAAGLAGRVRSVVDPVLRVFRARPAYASPGKLGASVSTFSPVVPVDEDVRRGSISGVATSVFDEVSGANVTVFDPSGAVVATTVTAADGTFLVDGLPILGESGTTYTVRVVRNGTLEDTETAHLAPFPTSARDVSVVLELFPPGH